MFCQVAAVCKTDEIRVYEVATFYTMFNRTRVGKYFLQLCGTTPCMICGSEQIKKTIEDHLHIKEGDTTEDGLFTLREVECMGSCANAPMIQVRDLSLSLVCKGFLTLSILPQMNDDYYECLTPETTIALLEACKAGNPPKMGRWGSLPMNGQVCIHSPDENHCVVTNHALCVQVSCEGPLGKTSLFEIPMDVEATMRTDNVFAHAKVRKHITSF
jgi:NADH dehydrogenase (ubiquinone) flavoprotein 2